MSKKYYVSVINGSARALLAGPFDNHQEAIGKVESARKAAIAVVPWAHFYAFGTAGIDLKKWGDRPLPVGKLNEVIK